MAKDGGRVAKDGGQVMGRIERWHGSGGRVAE